MSFLFHVNCLTEVCKDDRNATMITTRRRQEQNDDKNKTTKDSFHCRRSVGDIGVQERIFWKEVFCQLSSLMKCKSLLRTIDPTSSCCSRRLQQMIFRWRSRCMHENSNGYQGKIWSEPYKSPWKWENGAEMHFFVLHSESNSVAMMPEVRKDRFKKMSSTKDIWGKTGESEAETGE